MFRFTQQQFTMAEAIKFNPKTATYNGRKSLYEALQVVVPDFLNLPYANRLIQTAYVACVLEAIDQGRVFGIIDKAKNVEKKSLHVGYKLAVYPTLKIGVLTGQFGEHIAQIDIKNHLSTLGSHQFYASMKTHLQELKILQSDDELFVLNMGREALPPLWH
jgi:hypothetical protein